MQFTQEQEQIIRSTGDIKINAVAGSGKTTTVIEYARSRPGNARILYLAFNKSVKTEAEKKFKDKGLPNVKVHTAHSLAYRHVITGSNYRVKASGYKTHEIAGLLGLNGGGEKHAEYMIANHISKFISFFCNSNKERIQDLNYLEIVTDYTAREFVKRFYRYIETQALSFFEKMDSAEIEVTHDFYLKKLQLLNLQLKYDYILFDEGQDASAAILDVFLKQEATKVIVGDTHQQIYSWRHAVNSLEKVNFQTFHLSTSFRFGKAIAHLANRVLSWKNHIRAQEILTIKGEGKTTSLAVKAVIARTNLGLLLEVINLVTKKKNIKSIYFEGNINSYTYAEDGASLYDVLNLYNGKRHLIRDKLIMTMHSLDELEEYIEKTEDAQLGVMVEIVKEYGNAIPGLIQEIKSKHVADEQKDQAEFVFSTVHRCKGMEYDVIYLAADFITEKKISDTVKKIKEDSARAKLIEEINLLYVGLTRTKNILHLPKSLLPEDFPEYESICIIPPQPGKTDEQNDEVTSTSAFFLDTKFPESNPKEVEEGSVKEKKYSVEKFREKHKDAYMPWSEPLDKELTKLFREGKSVKLLAEYFERTKGAIYSRIKKLELK